MLRGKRDWRLIMNPTMGLERFKYEWKPKRMMGLAQNSYHVVATLGYAMATQ